MRAQDRDQITLIIWSRSVWILSRGWRYVFNLGASHEAHGRPPMVGAGTELVRGSSIVL
jgi:hypothetical protein